MPNEIIYGNSAQIVDHLSNRVEVLQKKVKQLEEENLMWRQKAEAYKIELDCLNDK